MDLNPHSKLGSYTIDREIGRGGMGVVYLATDTRLDRQVAIKALPEHLASDPDRLGRFEREAKTLASLNHPNVAGIYGVEEQDGCKYLVLEYVEGETLAAMLDRGPLPVDDAIELAVQIAAGVEAAHEAGVIHRDLKPGNIIITPEGKVKVLDFGLAKVAEGASSSGSFQTKVREGIHAPAVPVREGVPAPGAPAREGIHAPAAETVTSPVHRQHSPTMPGVILGTAAYMSPEQARGRSIDKRTDIWSFGVVLYECLTGANPFVGETVSDSIGAVLHKNLDLDRLPPTAPANIRRVLGRCLERDKAQRYRDVGDVALDLRATNGAVGLTPPALASSRVRRAALLALGFLLGAVVVAGLIFVPDGRKSSLAPSHLSVTLPSHETLNAGIEALLMAISPDGRRIAYCAEREGVIRLHVRHLGDPEPKVLEGAVDASDPFFSPDGQWVAYFSRGSFMKVSVRGGPAIKVADAWESRSGVWLGDDTIIFSPGYATPLMRVSASGGVLTPVTELDASRNERTHRWPDVSPNEKWVSFTVGTVDSPGAYDESNIEAVSLETGERRVLVRGGSMARWTSSGHLIYARHGVLFAVPIDEARATVRGTPTPVLASVAGETTSGAVHFAISRDGTLVYVSEDASAMDNELVWVDRKGNVETIGAPIRQYVGPRLSPDGKQILVTIGPGSGRGDSWRYDLQRGTLMRLTSDNVSTNAEWMPDQEHIVLTSDGVPPRLMLQSADASSPGEVLYESKTPFSISSVTSDGSGVLIWDYGDPDGDVHLVSTNGSGEVRTLIDDAGAQYAAVVSPDGNWIAYGAEVERGLRLGEIFVRPFQRPGGRRQVSTDGGTSPFWSRDGKELFYRRNLEIMVVPVFAEDGQINFGASKKLFDLPPRPQVEPTFRLFDVTHDGSRFLLVRSARDDGQMRRINVVLNWFDELSAEVPAGGLR